MNDIVEKLRSSFLGDENNYGIISYLPDAAADEIERLREREAKLREALENIATQNIPRPVAKQYRADGKPSKNDWCQHGTYLWQDCTACVAEYARSAALYEQEPDK